MCLDTVIEVVENEKECIMRADSCGRDCARCDLVRPTEEILEAYEFVLDVLEHLRNPNEMLANGFVKVRKDND